IIRTTISIVTSTARDKGIGSTIRNIEGMHLMVTEELRTSLVAMRVSSRGLVAQELALVLGTVPAAGQALAIVPAEVPVLAVGQEGAAPGIGQAAARGLAIVRAEEQARVIVPAEAVPAEEIARVAAEQALDQVVEAQELDRAVAEPEHVPVGAVREPDRVALR